MYIIPKKETGRMKPSPKQATKAKAVQSGRNKFWSKFKKKRNRPPAARREK